MNNANNLPPVSTSRPQGQPSIVQQQQQSPAILNATPVTLPTLPPATIVRAVFLPPVSDQQIQSRPFVSNPGPTYMFPTQQLHQYNSQCVDVACSTVGLLPTDPSSSSDFTTAPGPSTQQKRQKGQSKQPQQPRQSKSAKKQPKRQPEQNRQQQPQQQKASGSQQHAIQSGVRLTKKQQEKEDYYNRKYQLLRKCIRSLVFVSIFSNF